MSIKKKDDPVINTVQTTYNEDVEELRIQQEQVLAKAKIKSEVTIPVLIPADTLNPGFKFVPVIVNGVRFDVPVGKLVQVPQSVASVLANSDYIAPKLTVETFDNVKMP